MKSPYVREIEPSQTFTTTFLVQGKEIRQKKTGEPYLSLVLGDRTGDIEAKMWDNVSEVMETFERDDFVRVKALLQIYHNRPQLTIHRIQRIADGEIDFADYFRASKRDPDEMLTELRGVIAGIGSAPLRTLLEALFADPEIVRRFRIAPAAKQIHHAFLSGLIEHVLSLCSLCRATAAHYAANDLDLDLLLTGAILHDIGKIHELSYERSFSYTSDGQLLGHMMIALRMVGEKLAGIPDFPPRLRNLVEHMIISHHGRLEFGSPKVPMFPEALLLHYLDDLDSKMECMRHIIEDPRSGDPEFTAYHGALERPVLRRTRYLASPAKPPPAAAPPPPRPVQNHGAFGDKLRQALSSEGGQEG